MMTEVVTELEIALESQEIISEEKKQLIEYEEMTATAEPPLNYRSKAELMMLLSKGVLLNGGNTWFSVNTKGERCEMICMAECLIPLPTESDSYLFTSKYNSRFKVGCFTSFDGKFQTRVRTQFLSPLITYTVNLVFKFRHETKTKIRNIGLNYKLKGETKTSIAYLVDEREDGWMMVELYQFTSDQRNVDLEILFNGFNRFWDGLQIEGIEFQPLQKVEDEVFEDDKVDMQPASDSETNWDEKLPIDYEEIVKWSKDSIKWKTKKELYLIFRNGFLINNGQEWFFLDKNGKKCQVLSARAAFEVDYLTWESLPESRFGEAIVSKSWAFCIISEIKTQLLSPETTYASYLVYKLPKDQSRYESPVEVNNRNMGSDYWKDANFWDIYLVPPQTPVIRKTGDQQDIYNPLSRPKIKGLPRLRNDGWIEVQVWEFQTTTTTEIIPMQLKLISSFGKLTRLLLQGVEFRPV